MRNCIRIVYRIQAFEKEKVLIRLLYRTCGSGFIYEHIYQHVLYLCSSGERTAAKQSMC